MDDDDDDDDETRENDETLSTSMCGHFSAIMAIVGPPTYPAPMQHTVFFFLRRSREREKAAMMSEQISETIDRASRNRNGNAMVSTLRRARCLRHHNPKRDEKNNTDEESATKE